MRNRVVTVFGGSGFLGRHLVRRLAERGATIRVPTRRPERAGFLRPMGDVGQIALLPWSAGDQRSIEALVEGATDVVGLIGILFESGRGDFSMLQGELPGRIAIAAASAGVRNLVHVSAIGADPASPSVYARTKAAGEAGLRQGFPSATVLRPSVVFGPEDGFFNRFAMMAQISPFLPLVGGGHTRFQPVYVGDVADAVVAALSREDSRSRTYELGGPAVRSFRELLVYLLHVLGRRRLLLPLPFAVARLQAQVLQYLPEPPLTPDQVTLLTRDNVVTGGHPGLAELGITPTPMEAIVPTYVRPYARRTAAPHDRPVS